MIDLFIIHTGNFSPLCDQYDRPLLFSKVDDAMLFKNGCKELELNVLQLEKIPLSFESVHFSLCVMQEGRWRFQIVVFEFAVNTEQDKKGAENNVVINVNSPVLLNASAVTLSDKTVAKKGIGKNFIRP